MGVKTKKTTTKPDFRGMRDVTGKKHSDVIEWEKWLTSVEGRGCMNGRTFGVSAINAQYLMNRLWKAFMAGRNAGRKP